MGLLLVVWVAPPRYVAITLSLVKYPFGRKRGFQLAAAGSGMPGPPDMRAMAAASTRPPAAPSLGSAHVAPSTASARPRAAPGPVWSSATTNAATLRSLLRRASPASLSRSGHRVCYD